MKRKQNIQKILNKNPQIDGEKLSESLEIIDKLNQTGVPLGPDYGLSSPFERPNTEKGEPDKAVDAKQLRHSRG